MDYREKIRAIGSIQASKILNSQKYFAAFIDINKISQFHAKDEIYQE